MIQLVLTNIGADNCRRLLAEDPEREERRASLTKEKERLMKAKALLDSMSV